MSTLTIIIFIVFLSSILLIFFPLLYLRIKVSPFEKNNWFDRGISYQYGYIYICQKYNLVKKNLIIFVKTLSIINQTFGTLFLLFFFYEILSIYLEGSIKVYVPFTEKVSIIFYFIYKYYPLNISALMLLSNFLIKKILAIFLYFKYKDKIAFSLLDRLNFSYPFYVRLYEYYKESEKNRKRVNVLFTCHLISIGVIIIIWAAFIIQNL